MNATLNGLISLILFIATIVGTFITVKITTKNNSNNIDELSTDVKNGFKELNHKIESKFNLLDNKIEQLKDNQHSIEVQNVQEKSKIYLLISEIKNNIYDNIRK